MSTNTLPSTSSDESDPTTQPTFNEIISGETIEVSDHINIHVKEMIGEGTFGKIFSVLHVAKNREYAMKVLPLRNQKDRNSADSEANMLIKIHNEKAHREHIIRVGAIFERFNNLCILMEKMDIDLWAFIRQRNHRPLPVEFVKIIGKQLFSALARLHSMGIMHTDVKPENIMFVNREQDPWFIKLVDLGSASRVQAAKDNVGRAVQTLCYRCPEVLFGMPFDERIDVWSAGCVLAELYLGCHIYPGTSEYQMIQFIASTQGLPSNLAKSSMYCSKFMACINTEVVNADLKHTRTMYRMKNGVECEASGVDRGHADQRWYKFRGIKNITQYGYSKLLEGELRLDDEIFASFLCSVLAVNGFERLFAAEARQHLFLQDVEGIIPITPTKQVPAGGVGPIRRQTPSRKDTILTRKPLGVLRQ